MHEKATIIAPFGHEQSDEASEGGDHQTPWSRLINFVVLWSEWIYYRFHVDHLAASYEQVLREKQTTNWLTSRFISNIQGYRHLHKSAIYFENQVKSIDIDKSNWSSSHWWRLVSLPSRARGKGRTSRPFHRGRSDSHEDWFRLCE